MALAEVPCGSINETPIFWLNIWRNKDSRSVFDILVWPTSMLGNGPPVMV
jgi:hypothetical protein